jgi:hypothetical protein
MSRACLATVALAAVTGLGACTSGQEDNCQVEGSCAGQSDDWIAACRANASALKQDAVDNNCSSAHEAYHSCVTANYSCTELAGGVVGCSAKRAALDACLGLGTGTYCDRLVSAETSCHAVPVDGGDGGALASAPDGGSVSCNLSLDCQAACYLAGVADVCGPTPTELTAVATCAASCP